MWLVQKKGRTKLNACFRLQTMRETRLLSLSVDYTFALNDLNSVNIPEQIGRRMQTGKSIK